MKHALQNLPWSIVLLMVLNVALLFATITTYRDKDQMWTEYRFQETTRKILEKKAK